MLNLQIPRTSKSSEMFGRDSIVPKSPSNEHSAQH